MPAIVQTGCTRWQSIQMILKNGFNYEWVICSVIMINISLFESNDEWFELITWKKAGKKCLLNLNSLLFLEKKDLVSLVSVPRLKHNKFSLVYFLTSKSKSNPSIELNFVFEEMFVCPQNHFLLWWKIKRLAIFNFNRISICQSFFPFF